MTKVIFFGFMGRTENMEVARPHLTRLLDETPGAELHLWDLTRDVVDALYVREWAASDDRARYRGSAHPGNVRCTGPKRRGVPPCRCAKHSPPYEKVWGIYAREIARGEYDADTVFVKFDDDVIWIDTGRFGEVLSFLETHPDQIASANVTNNAVCAKYEPGLRDALMEEFDLGDPTDPVFDRDWWALHTDACFAWLSHHWLLDLIQTGKRWPSRDRLAFQTRFGEAISINFVAMKAPMLEQAAGVMSGFRHGDEAAVDSFLPWIIPNFRVAHLAFGPQEASMGVALPALRRQYSNPNLPVTPVIHV